MTRAEQTAIREYYIGAFDKIRITRDGYVLGYSKNRRKWVTIGESATLLNHRRAVEGRV